jgi:hypothetical protein
MSNRIIKYIKKVLEMNPFRNAIAFFRQCYDLYNIYQFYMLVAKIFGAYPLFISPFHKKMSIYYQIFFDIVYKADRENQLTIELLKLELKKLDAIEKFICSIFPTDSYYIFITHNVFDFWFFVFLRYTDRFDLSKISDHPILFDNYTYAQYIPILEALWIFN